VASSEEFYQKIIASERWRGLYWLRSTMPKMFNLLQKEDPLRGGPLTCEVDVLVNNFHAKEKHFSMIADKERNIYLEKLQKDLKNSDAINSLDAGFLLRHSPSLVDWLANANDLRGVSKDTKIVIKLKENN